MTIGVKLIPVLPDKALLNLPQLFVTLERAVTDQVAEGVRFMSIYPPKPGSSRYRRTGTLRRSWSFRVASGNRRIEGTIGSASNIAPYNRDVQGPDQKDLFKQIGWPNTEDLDKKMAKDFPKRIQTAIGRAA